MAARVDGHPILAGELRAAMESLRAGVMRDFRERHGLRDYRGFWERTFGDERPLEVLRNLALQTCVREEIEQILAVELGLVSSVVGEPWAYPTNAVTEARGVVEQTGDIVYGPVSASPETRQAYRMRRLRAALEERLMERGLLHGPADATGGEAGGDVYAAYVEERTQRATVWIDESIVQRVDLEESDHGLEGEEPE